LSQAKIFERQVATVVRQSASEARDREGLAGGSSDKKVNCIVLIRLDGGEIAVQRHVGITVRKDRARVRVDLREERRPPPQRMPSGRCGFDTGANGAVKKFPARMVFHGIIPFATKSRC
jgi:hypothetical protein